MSISALSSSNVSQLSFLSRLSSTNAGSSAEATRAAPPPRPPEGGGFASAIADALAAIGITDASITGGTTDSSTSTAAAAGGTDSTDANTKLADFLQALSSKVGGSGTSGSLVNTTV